MCAHRFYYEILHLFYLNSFFELIMHLHIYYTYTLILNFHISRSTPAVSYLKMCRGERGHAGHVPGLTSSITGGGDEEKR